MSSSKNIAIICKYDLKPERIGGMDRFYVAYNKALQEQGHQATWFFSKYESFDFFKDLNIKSASDGNVEDCFLSYDAQHFDTIITHFVALCTPFYKAIKTKHSATIIAVDHNPRPLKGFPIKKRIKNKIKGLLYSRYIDQFISVSEYTRNCILKDYGIHLVHKTKTIYNGIDTTSYERRTDANVGKWIVASHLRESKGVQDLISAVAMLKPQTRRDLCIDIYGEGPMEEQLKQQAVNARVDTIFNFKGSTSDLYKLYKNYSYMIQPTYMECFSLSILESLVCNVPVVTTQVGGNLEVVKHEKNGFIYPAGNVKALHYMLTQILVNLEEVSQVDVATPVAEKFNLTKMVSDHLELISA